MAEHRSLGATVSATNVTLEGRAFAEEQMRDTCTAVRPTGGFVTDPETGVDEPESVHVYPTPEQIAAGNPGRCKVQTRVAQAASPDAGGHQFTVENLQLHFPVSAELQNGDQVTITESWDPQLVGLVFRLVELARGTYRTADRWNVELVTA